MEKNPKVQHMAMTAVMTAVICILGPLSIPIGLVPISFTNLAIYIALYALGQKKGTISYIIYVLVGFVGIPVFSNYTGGAAKLLGPTGGYLIGFIPMALIAGFFIDKFSANRSMCFLGMVLGTALCYTLGTTWLSYQANMPLNAALAAGVLPFIPGDIAKILIATIVGPQIRKRLINAGLFEA